MIDCLEVVEAFTRPLLFLSKCESFWDGGRKQSDSLLDCKVVRQSVSSAEYKDIGNS